MSVLTNHTKIAVTIVMLLECLMGCASGAGGQRGEGEYGFNDNSLLWQVTSPAGKTSYVFGTIHVADSAVFMQRDTVLKLLSQSTSFWAELNLDSAMNVDDAMSMAGNLLLPAGKTLSQFYTEEEMVVIRKGLAERMGPMAAGAEHMKPGALVAMLMMDSAASNISESIDEFLWNRAASLHLRLHGIERVDEQFAIIDSMPPRMLLEALQSDGSSDVTLEDLQGAYAQEQLSTIVALVDSLSGLDAFMLTINDDRNDRMVQRLTAAIDQGGAFIAVGAAHLGGKQGLLAEFARAGYAVAPVFGGRRVQWLTHR